MDLSGCERQNAVLCLPFRSAWQVQAIPSFELVARERRLDVALEGHSRAKAALYGLDWLAKHPDASVVICEGEKSADAAAGVCPNSVCITSPGGSQAASKADWSPLEARRILVWPDADEPGAKYAATVAGKLHGQASEVLTRLHQLTGLATPSC
jgi:hypothetical protein